MRDSFNENNLFVPKQLVEPPWILVVANDTVKDDELIHQEFRRVAPLEHFSGDRHSQTP